MSDYPSRTMLADALLEALPLGTVDFLKEEIRVGNYLEKKRKIFFGSGIAIISLRLLVIICWTIVGLITNNLLSGVVAVASIAEIVSATFLITLGCKPMRWLAGRVFALSLFSALGNISAIGPAFVFLVGSTNPTNTLVGWVTISFHVVLSVIFMVCASYAAYGLRCSICCTPREEAERHLEALKCSPTTCCCCSSLTIVEEYEDVQELNNETRPPATNHHAWENQPVTVSSVTVT